MDESIGYVLCRISAGLLAVLLFVSGCGAEPAARPRGAQGAANPVETETEGGSAGLSKSSARSPIGGVTGAPAAQAPEASPGAGSGGEPAAAGSGYDLSVFRGAGSGVRGPGSPRVSLGGPSVSGAVPSESIERIVRLRYGRIRSCYDAALLRNPTLAGRAAVRFLIREDGAIERVTDSGSEIRDKGLLFCVVRAFQSLQFPESKSGTTTVVYPIRFDLPRLPAQYESPPVQAPSGPAPTPAPGP